MRASGLGHSTRSDPADAAAEASDRAQAALGGVLPRSAIVVATAAYGGERAAQALVGRACSALGSADVVGAALDGVMVGGAEWAAEPAVAVLALGGERDGGGALEVALLEDVAGHEAGLGSELSGAFSTPVEPGDLVVVFAEPQALDGAAAARGLRGLPTAGLVGIAAGEVAGESQPVWAGEDVVRGGLAALRVARGAGPPARVALSQAGRPLGEPMRITGARGHWITSLEGRPALEVYRSALPSPLRQDLPRASRSVLVALEGGGDGDGHGVHRRIRNVIGFDDARGAFSVAEAPGADERLALVALDGAAAREELGRLEARLVGPGAAAALYLNCRARASALFEHEGYELGRVGALVGGCPVLGLMGSHLYGASAPRAPISLHTYAAVAALIDA